MSALRAFGNRSKIVFFFVFGLCLVLAGVFTIASIGQLRSHFRYFVSESVEAETSSGPFKLVIRLDKGVFSVGEIVPMNIRLVNAGEENVTIVFSNRPVPNEYWFDSVYNETNHLIFYYKLRVCLPAEQPFYLEPSMFLQRNCTWNQVETNTGKQVPLGNYTLVAAVAFDFNKEPVQIETPINITIKAE